MGTDLIIFLTKKTQNMIKYKCIKREIKGTGLNIAILVTLLSSVPFITIINPVPFISEKVLNEVANLDEDVKWKKLGHFFDTHRIPREFRFEFDGMKVKKAA